MKIVNMTASAKMEPITDLDSINLVRAPSRKRRDRNYHDSLHFIRLRSRIQTRQGPVSVQIFQTGSVVFVGAKSNEALNEAYQRVTEHLKERKPLIISNFVGSFTFEKTIDLRRLPLIKPSTWSFVYEPESFPSAVLTTGVGKIVVFASGKINLTGYRQVEQMRADLGVFLLKLRSDDFGKPTEQDVIPTFP